MVRAPKPVACGGMTDARLEDDEGVATAPEVFFTGVRIALVEDDRV